MVYAVPGQAGRLFVVTGANSGIGGEAARRLAGAGARVVLAVRTPAKGEQARQEILARAPAGRLEVRRSTWATWLRQGVRRGRVADGTPWTC